ncbi:glutamate--tRNA ligase [Roseitalea porphyridii]|uniref:Glutamate--tRNA ligase n=1 Tax=Roseitalea porphyridii TaxID=1852022 RepID=A0A4P6V2A5_9HYPH|nr:glutamate--tRNA ligase [Roseitalea porphyridii]QBK31023.1 glutamate--tRNA ligase [Roseitalea porphyridii]
MSVTVRFAPSPTGHIHIGNARTALFNWLFARQNDGRFILRFDDTDAERSKAEFAHQIAADLRWLGIEPDRTAYQSRRMDAYQGAAEKLKRAGLLYPCYETPDELERRRRIRLSRKLPPVYGREALKLTEDEKAAYEAEGRTPHWRFLLPNFDDDPFAPERTDVHWADIVRGPQGVDLASMSDPVLIRGDGSYLYTLPSVVDDMQMEVTHVIRGDDHVTNTGAQIALFEALGGEAPAFGHHNLLTAASGEGLSKRSGALSIKSLAGAGFEPMTVASLAVLTGSSTAISAMADMDALTEAFDIGAASRSAAKFDSADLDGLNETLVHGLAFDAVRDRLADAGIDVDDRRAETFWAMIRANVKKVPEAADWWPIIVAGPTDEAALDGDDLDYARNAFDVLPEGEVDGTTWKAWTDAAKAQSGRKGRALFMPLRIALTGRAWGPELSDLLPLLGREEILRRRP